MSFLIGEAVGPYRIVEQLGSGGMATVFKAYHANLDRYVALKVLHPAFKQDPNFLSRFQREARIVAKLQHPAIVPVYDFNEHNGQPYLVMRFIEGETLKARLLKGELALPEILRIMKPVGAALAYAHQQGVLHRDVKPSNILLTPDGGVFLADFGLARIAQAGESTLSQDTMVGTPQYISPEQARGDADLDARTDIYSLGVVLYELLVGRVPYQADTPYAVIHDHIFTPLPLPRSLNPDFPEPLERVLLKALAKDRDDRYASVSELLSAFEQTAQRVISSASTQIGTPTTVSAPTAAGAATATVPPPIVPATASTSQPAAAPARSRKAIWLVGLLGVIAIIVIVAVVVINGRPQQRMDTPPLPPSAGSQNGQPPDQPVPDLAAAEQTFVRANDLATAGRLDRAHDEFLHAAEQAEAALNAKPGPPPEMRGQLHSLAGESWLVINQPDRAQPHFEEITRLAPDNAEPWVGVAAAQLMRGELDPATATLDRAIQLNADLPATHLVNACLALKQGDRARALREARLVGGPEARQRLPAWIRLVLDNLDCREEQFR